MATALARLGAREAVPALEALLASGEDLGRGAGRVRQALEDLR